jgi:hypothetical protein
MCTELRINIQAVAANLGESLGRPISDADATEWLVKHGFLPSRGLWRTSKPVELLLGPSEIIEQWTTDASGAHGENPSRWWPPIDGAPVDIPPIEALRKMPNYESCTIPCILRASRCSQVRKNWVRVAKRLPSARSWREAMNDLEFVHIDALNLPIVSIRVPAAIGGDAVYLQPVFDDFGSRSFVGLAGKQRLTQKEGYLLFRELMIEGSKTYWFSLCFCLSQGHFWVPVISSAYADDVRNAAIAVLRNVMVWWPHICARQGKFRMVGDIANQWPRWLSMTALFSQLALWGYWSHDKLCALGGQNPVSFGNDVLTWLDGEAAERSWTRPTPK